MARWKKCLKILFKSLQTLNSFFDSVKIKFIEFVIIFLASLSFINEYDLIIIVETFKAKI